jgi:glycosyltransferase involved in cell wall biosynthesis
LSIVSSHQTLPPGQEPAPLAGRTLAFIVTEDWFFASHFLPMARAAVGLGLDVRVIARERAHRSSIEATGARLIAFEAERSSVNPAAAGYASGQLAAVLQKLKPDLVHCIALRGILVGGAACMMARIPRRIYALTGLGYLGVRSGLTGAGARTAVRMVIRNLLETKETHYLFENPDDPGLLGLEPNDTARVTVIGGAGIDPEAFPQTPLPPMPPLKVAIVSRMLWSKGIDVAVDAVRAARASGAAVELHLFGAPDPSNPKSVPEAQLRQWSAEEGIQWHGPAANAEAVWRRHHVCCLPSRGGEGMPRTLLEGGACGRALLTTDVPGCRHLVRDGVEGLLTPPGDAGALAQALIRLAAHPDLVRRMGEAAAARIRDGFTEQHVADAVGSLYRRLLS